MKFFIVFAAVVAVALAAPADDASAQIVNQEDNRNPDGTYSERYEIVPGLMSDSVC